MGRDANSATACRPTELSLCLLGRFSVQRGTCPVEIGLAGQRLLALVALLGGVGHRSRLAGTLWPDTPVERSLANLRAALWRIPEVVRGQVVKSGASIALSRWWTIDLDNAVNEAQALGDCRGHTNTNRDLFTRDLLPDWDGDWLIVPRERHRQLRLHALEDLAAAELAAGRALDAVDTAMHAVAAEPLRESAQIILLRAHLAAGNRAAAIGQYEQFRALLDAELGLEPGPVIRTTIAEATSSR